MLGLLSAGMPCGYQLCTDSGRIGTQASLPRVSEGMWVLVAWDFWGTLEWTQGATEQP